MKHHEIQCVGKFWMHRIPTLTTWTVEDVGRLVFVIDTNSVYYGGTVEYGDWIDMSSHFIDVGPGTDPIDGSSFLGREYILRMYNGNMRFYY